ACVERVQHRCCFFERSPKINPFEVNLALTRELEERYAVFGCRYRCQQRLSMFGSQRLWYLQRARFCGREIGCKPAFDMDGDVFDDWIAARDLQAHRDAVVS